MSKRNLRTIESCHSFWLFDEKRHRLRRVLKQPVADPPIVTEWRHYDRVLCEGNSDAFIVFLDPLGSHVLRASRHIGPDCSCCADQTEELSVRELMNYIATHAEA